MSTAAAATAYLIVVAGEAPQALRLAVGEYIVGRAPNAALRLLSMEVSRTHCRLKWDGAHCQLEDLGSSRGTKVNGQPITSAVVLRPQDRVELGAVVLEFGLGEPAAATVTQNGPDGQPVVLFHQQAVERIPLDGTLRMGRDPAAEVFLNDPGISRDHATLRTEPGVGTEVEDKHSTGGTFVNGRRFAKHKLVVGDRLQLGPFCFLYDGQALIHCGAARGSTVEARHVEREVPTRKLLEDVSVTIPASQFIGLLGPSGAGKSTLLKILAGLDAPSAGEVIIDGENIYQSGHTPSFGYVPQQDIVHRELTARQSLRFSARLRLPKVTPAHEIESLVDQTIKQLELEKYQNTPFHRLSGGQQKRVSVGVELLARPAILFLDEPSSGLDPATEFYLMELLRDLASGGCTIVCTTHVIENAFLMDQLIVLTWGCLAFQGPASEVRKYFGVPKLLSVYDRLREQSPKDWQTKFAEYRASQAIVEEEPTIKAPPPQRPLVTEPPRRRAALPILLHRQAAILASDWRSVLLLMGQPVLVGLLVSWVANTPELALFFAYLTVLWFGCSNAAQEIVKELPIYLRERLVGLSRHAYLVSKFLAQVAITWVQALLVFFTLKLCMPELDGSPLWQLTGLFAIGASAVGIGCAISALSRNMMQAVLVVPLVLIPQILFSGYTVPPPQMKPSVLTVSRFIPTFAAQRIMDASFFWGHPVNEVLEAADALDFSVRRNTLASLKADFVPRAPKDVTESPDARQERTRHDIGSTESYGFSSVSSAFKAGSDTGWRRFGPLLRALLTSAGWTLVGYVVAFAALALHERKK